MSKPSTGAEFDHLVQQLAQCGDALQGYDGPILRREVTDGADVETLVDHRQLIVRDAARTMSALNAARHNASPQQLRAYYETAVGYAQALQRHTDNQDLVERIIRAAEHGLRMLDDWERQHSRR